MSATHPSALSPLPLPPVDETPAAVIASVHESANVQYRIAKQHKQALLAHKVADAEKRGDRAGLKTAKKRVDNHASAVASRVKQEFLVTAFEHVITATMNERAHMASSLRKANAEIERLVREKELLQVNLLVQKNALTTTPQHQNPSQPTPAWSQPHPHQLAPAHSTAQSHNNHSDLFSEFSDPNPTSEHHQHPHLDPMPALSSFIDEWKVRGPSDPSKLDPTPWELYHRQVVSERQASVRARLKEEEDTDHSFNPVA